MNAFCVGGTIRATLNTAGELARRHDVEILSVYRRRDEPALPVPPGVRLRTLTDLRPATLERTAAERGVGARVRTAAARRPSRVMSPFDVRYRTFNLLSDANLLRFLLSVRDGVLVGTRPAINLAIAQLVAPSVVRIGQDHLNLSAYEPALRAQMRRAYPRLDLLTALTEDDAAGYHSLLGGQTRVERMPNGIPSTGTPRAALDARVVIAAGRLTRQKGFDRLLRVWKLVADRHPDWELRIYGSGQDKRDLRRQIRRSRLGSTARLMGFTPRLHEAFAEASLYVMSSRREGFPMVLLEAMQAGLPVVSYDCPTGPRDIVREGVDGHVVPNGDREALAAALSGLMADTERRKAFGAAAVENAARYDVARMAERWEALFDELAAAKGSRRSTAIGPATSLIAGMGAARARRVLSRRHPLPPRRDPAAAGRSTSS
jgi:glycosyltransferase involved in cell wall biosynthesis